MTKRHLVTVFQFKIGAVILAQYTADSIADGQWLSQSGIIPTGECPIGLRITPTHTWISSHNRWVRDHYGQRTKKHLKIELYKAHTPVKQLTDNQLSPDSLRMHICGPILN